MPKKGHGKRKASKPRPKQRPLPKTPIKSPATPASKNSTDSRDSNKVPKAPPPVPPRPIAKNSTDTTKSSDNQNKKPPLAKKDAKLNDVIKNKSGKKVKSGEKDSSNDKDPQDPNAAVNQALPKDGTGKSGAASKDTAESRDQPTAPFPDRGTAPDYTKITKPRLPHVKIKVAKEKLKKDPIAAAAQASARKLAAARSVALSAKCSGEAFRTDLFGATFLAPYTLPMPEKASKEAGIESNTTSSEDE
uniref:Neurofilament heavy polypeptide-like n=1 Tax=Panagrellus redivivus TaxID=6233 RepID=A0A7E4ZRB6_PANRE